MAHFGFDYAFPHRLPILGPAKEFQDHHDMPTLDPSDYVVNLSKGAYCSLPLSICVLVPLSPSGSISFLVVCTLLGMSFWAFFLHQIHSYAHMGSSLSPEELNWWVKNTAEQPTRKAQIREFDRLFATVAINPVVRLLQTSRVILKPSVHNLHHLSFETDFSSVNGWADPIANLVLRPLARRIKCSGKRDL